MTEGNNQTSAPVKRNRHIGLKIFIILFVLLIGVILFMVVTNTSISDIIDSITPKATIEDIDGNWSQSLLSDTFTFIPSKNIKGLVLQFDIYDDNYKLLNTITKSIGNVKKGQQYTVTITLDEYWSGTQVKTSVKEGTISLF